jgi:predicted enzyme related to lactoylglutathione lyase
VIFPRLRDFYRGLGWPQIIDDGQFAAFELRGVVLAVFPIAQLARDGNTEPDPGSTVIRFTVGIMVDTAEEVDRLTEQMRNAGARVTKEPVAAEFFTGRSAYLCDPEGNYFEITWPSRPTRSHRAALARPDRHLAQSESPKAPVQPDSALSLPITSRRLASSAPVQVSMVTATREWWPGRAIVSHAGAPRSEPAADVQFLRLAVSGVPGSG